MTKKIIPIAIILIAVAAVGGYFIWEKHSAPTPAQPTTSQSTNETANWKTYTNDKYRFEVNYPLTYQVLDTLAKEAFYKETISKVVSFTGKDNYIDDSTFSVYVDDNSSNLSTCLKDYNGVDLTKTKEINGNTFYIYFDKIHDSSMGGARSFLSQYRIIHNNYCYILDSRIYWHDAGSNGITSSSTLKEMQAQNDAIKTHSDFLDKILSTFKFLDETANWKTYTNEKYGFEFKYPPSMLAGDGRSAYDANGYYVPNGYSNPVNGAYFETLNLGDKGTDQSHPLYGFAGFIIYSDFLGYPDTLPVGETLLQYVQSNLKHFSIITTRTISPVTVNGTEGYVVEPHYSQNNITNEYPVIKIYYFQNGTKIFPIVGIANYHHPPEAADMQAFDQVVSTFKFTSNP